MSQPVPDLAGVFTNLRDAARNLAQVAENGLALLGKHEALCRQREREPRADPMNSPTETPSALMTRHEVADLMRMDVRTLGRLRNDPSAKFPQPLRRTGVLRWRRASIERWIAARES